MTEHVEGRRERQEFNRELGAIDAKVTELLTMVAEDLPRATDALLNVNSEAVRALAERDRAIDSLYPEIEELAERELLLQQPAASDFRLLISVLRVVPQIERSHDLIVDIARRGSLLPGQDLPERSRGLIERMGTLHPKCGARPSIAGVSATVPLRLRSVSVTMRWTTCMPA